MTDPGPQPYDPEEETEYPEEEIEQTEEEGEDSEDEDEGFLEAPGTARLDDDPERGIVR